MNNILYLLAYTRYSNSNIRLSWTTLIITTIIFCAILIAGINDLIKTCKEKGLPSIIMVKLITKDIFVILVALAFILAAWLVTYYSGDLARLPLF